MRYEDTHMVADELGQPPLVTDTEFSLFVNGNEARLPFFRRWRVKRLLAREPWRSRIQQNRERNAASSFMNPTPAERQARLKRFLGIR